MRRCRFKSLTSARQLQLKPKVGFWTIDDTDSSSDDEDHPKAMSAIDPYLEEWNLYLNTNEAVLDDVEIVQW